MEVFAICGGVVFWPMAALAWWHFTKKARPWIRYGGFTAIGLIVALACWGTLRAFEEESVAQESSQPD
jgi:ABC-type nickel/cobalt efflux system permease component RcnA